MKSRTVSLILVVHDGGAVGHVVAVTVLVVVTVVVLQETTELLYMFTPIH